MKDRTGQSQLRVQLDGHDYILIVGGAVAGELQGPALFSVEGLFWAALGQTAAPPALRSGINAGVVNGSVILAGGRGADGKAVDSVEIYSLLEDKVTSPASLARPRAEAAAAVFDEQLIVIGGTDDTEIFTTSELVSADGLAHVGPTLPFPLVSARAASLPDGSVVVVGGDTGAGLATKSLLLTHVPPGTNGEGLLDRPRPGGDVCDTAVPLEASSGSFSGSAFRASDDLDLGSLDQCLRWTSHGRDTFVSITLAPHQSVDMELYRRGESLDLAFAVFESCPPARCLQAADAVDQTARDTEFSPEYLSFANDSNEAKTYFVAIDGVSSSEPYGFGLEWTVTP